MSSNPAVIQAALPSRETTQECDVLNPAARPIAPSNDSDVVMLDDAGLQDSGDAESIIDASDMDQSDVDQDEPATGELQTREAYLKKGEDLIRSLL